ncbi:MAG: hypothetical protein QF464_19545, partial [Myxococcota bacterium]|nr:hypothetical protein [Myxococcota bacterium]
RTRPSLQTLDVDTINSVSELSLSACEAARRDVDIESQVSDVVLTPADLPRLARYATRVAGQWAVIGSRSGFLHKNRWDSTTGACSEDPNLTDARYTARLVQRQDAASYESCPPDLDQLGHDASQSLYSPPEQRFTNFSFSVDVFEGCAAVDGEIVASPSQRDTRWTFALSGPDAPLVTSAGRINSFAGAVLHSPRIPQLTLRRQQVELDTSGRRVHVLQVRANALDHVATFD